MARSPLNLLSTLVVSVSALAFVLWIASLDVGASSVFGDDGGAGDRTAAPIPAASR
jgi:hypothetical protein